MNARRRTSLDKAQSGGPVLPLTSLIDVMVVLIFFLLKSLVLGGDVMTPAPGISLPHSTSEAQPEQSLVVTVFPNHLLVGDEPVSFEAPPDDLLLPALAERLSAVNAQADDLARRRGETPEASRRATIQGDRSIEFSTLERVMFTLHQAGYDRIALAVLQAG